MTTLTSKYTGGLRTILTHTRSNSSITTDAPVDNHGRGEAFSPTDLLSAALCSCMITVMGIYAEKEGIDLTGLSGEVVKTMSSDPRRVSKIDIVLSYDLQATADQKQKLKEIALSCPVALSLSESLRQNIKFNF
ncbi:MAG: OsmC family protein [Flammeovirgaceae bacterium]|nr:OsmC family protein [Flammeovirgaceae bacterium]